REPRRDDVIEQRAFRQLLALKGGVAVKKSPPLRGADGAVHDDARVPHEAVEQGPEARIATEGRRSPGARCLEHVCGLVKELAREEVTLVGRVPEREPC